MILILSENKDSSTTQVIEWLNFFNKKWVRINGEEKIQIECIGEDFLFITDDFRFKLSEISSFWYRRGFFNIKLNLTEINEFNEQIKREASVLIQYIHYKLFQIKHIDSIKNVSVNKLIINSQAEELGFLTPKSYIFSNKTELKKVIDNNDEQFITKTIADGSFLNFKDHLVYNYTSKINLDNIVSEKFAPSLAQVYTKKKYELRIFYLLGRCYAMAIFSQKDDQTTIDFRNYNDDQPNRNIPYNLPIAIGTKVCQLMKKLNFDSGSIDMIVTPDNQFIFLELNPFGQFGMTSYPCNYNVEKIIAENL
ncbi:grasp-with-spasm system ATP-grasp peptide maturase [Flavobacterium sp.]|uniref:grasp-with-spasm system ATP-grasp peptide maturase n=1 Tax=Flavobacterium sp. TaxID=239 RepID=UPI003D6B8CDD